MNRQKSSSGLARGVVVAVVFGALLPVGSAESQTPPPIVQPGAPGEATRRITAEEASNLDGVRYTEADVSFMQGMISHHAQALEMTDLLSTRSESDVMHRLAKRIELSQKDEIEMMQEWLRSHGHEVTDVGAHHAHGAELMPGMLSVEEMNQLEQARGSEFDRLFLELMIEHHRGALIMVEELLAQPASGQASEIFAFTADIVADQSMEIDRMGGMLADLAADPRVHLAPGFRDAGEAMLNLELVAALPKPAGFFDPKVPEGLPTPPERPASDSPDEEETEDEEKESAKPAPRPAILNFANSDLAFAGDVLFEGNFHGFNTYNVEDPLTPQLLGSVVCPGGQGDVSIYGNLLFMSVEQTRGRLDCGLQGVGDPVSDARFRGVRIFDISDVRMPRQVAAVQTCRGSHTHTLVTDPDDDGNVYLYGSGTSSVRSAEELAMCSDAKPEDDSNTALFSIDVIRVPVARPQDARIVNRPRIFSDPESGIIAGLWRGGNHGPGTQKTSETNQCHDITVYPEVGLAAGACSGNGILLDISDPVNPVRLDQVVDPSFAYWHSATFNNDGTKVVFTDEWGGGLRPRCRASDPKEWGANAIFDIVDRKLKFRSHYKMPAAQSELENCVAHNGSLIPVPGRDIMVQAWYQGGISVFDFTDSANPVEIAFFDRGPVDGEELTTAGHWSAYWYNGYIYGTEIARGLDVLKLLPSTFLSQNEIDAANLIAPEVVNVQQQRRIDWPANPVVARALLDQLGRTGGIDAGRAEAVTAALDRADGALAQDPPTSGATASELDTIAAELERDRPSARGRDQERLASLASTIHGVAEKLR